MGGANTTLPGHTNIASFLSVGRILLVCRCRNDGVRLNLKANNRMTSCEIAAPEIISTLTTLSFTSAWLFRRTRETRNRQSVRFRGASKVPSSWKSCYDRDRRRNSKEKTFRAWQVVFHRFFPLVWFRDVSQPHVKFTDGSLVQAELLAETAQPGSYCFLTRTTEITRFGSWTHFLRGCQEVYRAFSFGSHCATPPCEHRTVFFEPPTLISNRLPRLQPQTKPVYALDRTLPHGQSAFQRKSIKGVIFATRPGERKGRSSCSLSRTIP